MSTAMMVSFRPNTLPWAASEEDEARFQRREVLTPLWEKHVLTERLFNIQLHRALTITD